jgi:hypothetical protein
VIIPVNLIPCHLARRSFSDQLFSDQVSSRTRSVREQSGFSRVNVEKSSIAYSSMIRAHTFKSSESGKGRNPGSIEVFAKLLLVAITSVECCTLSSSPFSLHHGQFFRPLDLIFVGITTVRRHDATKPSSSATVLAPPRPHGLTVVELRAVYTRYPAG